MTKLDLLNLYSLDNEFVSIYHGNSNWSVEQCVEDSWNGIKDLELHNTEYGYIAINRDDLIIRLAGFFIKPEFRNKAGKALFIADLKRLMPDIFMAYIHSSNKKAIKFLSSIGTITKDDKITTYIVFRQENICLG